MNDRVAITDSGLRSHAEVYIKYVRLSKDPQTRFLSKSRVYELSSTPRVSSRRVGEIIQIINRNDKYRVQLEKVIHDYKLDGLFFDQEDLNNG